ncbi:hypothetical protein [Micromonospora endophytica]|nr:hypothetical protein [Micromonospora endophytica]
MPTSVEFPPADARAGQGSPAGHRLWVGLPHAHDWHQDHLVEQT